MSAAPADLFEAVLDSLCLSLHPDLFGDDPIKAHQAGSPLTVEGSRNGLRENLHPVAHSAIATVQAFEQREGLSSSEAWQELVEKDDRTSPEEYPEMALITREELASFMEAAHCLAAATALQTDPRDAVGSFIEHLASVSEGIAWQAGVGSCEIAGGIVSYLAQHPERLAAFQSGGFFEMCPKPSTDLFREGRLSWIGQDGKIWTPQDVAVAIAQREAR